MDVGFEYLSGLGFEEIGLKGMEKFQRYDVLKDLLIAEDRVFGDRMNIFLVVNSIMLIAFGQFKVPGFVIPALGVVIDLIWLYVGSLTLSAHNFWLGKITGFSSTESLAYLLPLAFMAIWVYLLVK